jgi:Na+/proline symporter
MLFNGVHDAELRTGPARPQFEALEQEFAAAAANRRLWAERAAEARRSADVAAIAGATDRFRAADQAVTAIRRRAIAFVRQTTGDPQYNDVNYVFPTFITTRMPIGLVGLMIAAIFAAAMSSIAAELNSLATSTVIDIYRRLLRPAESDKHYLTVSKLATGFWGIFACGVAVFAASLGSLIEVVNRFGSFFYGSLLGVFMLALLVRRANGTGAFVGLAAGIAAVATFAIHPATKGISFLWQNPLGVIVVLVVGTIVSLATGGSRRETTT